MRINHFIILFAGTNWAKEIMRQILYRDETLDKLTNLLPINLRVLEIDPCEYILTTNTTRLVSVC